MRERCGFICRALNIPLKIHCSKADSFQPSFEPFVDARIAHWMDLPLRAARDSAGAIAAVGR
jgi:hypothetical protein